MPIITKISVQKKNKQRVNIFIDNEYLFSLNIETVLKNQLKTTNTLSAKDLDNLVIESDGEKVLSKILNFLSYRPRSEKELVNRLFKYTSSDKNSQQAITNYVLSYLKKRDLIDDHSFAIWFVNQRQTHRPRSLRHLYSELMFKGIKKDIIDIVILKSQYDEHKEIKKIISKKKLVNSLKAIKYLARKGFKYNLIKETLS